MSNIRDTDILLVNRAGSSFHCSKANIDNVRDTDTFLVNRDGTSYYVAKSDVSTNVRDTDLVLVNRSGASYKGTGADLKGAFTNRFSAPLQSTSTSGNQGDYTPIYGTSFTNTGNAFDGDEDTDATILISSASIFPLTKDNIYNGRPFLQNVSTVDVLAWCEGGVSASFIVQVTDNARAYQIGSGFSGKWSPDDANGKKWAGEATFSTPIDIRKLQIAQTGGTGQTAHIYAWKINGELMANNADYGLQLNFANGTNMTLLEAGDTVEQGATIGTVDSITNTSALLSSSAGTWINGVNVTGPEKP